MKAETILKGIMLLVFIGIFVGLYFLVHTDPGTPLWIDRFASHRPGGSGGFLFLVLLVPGLFFYALPTIVAGGSHPRLGLVATVNLLFGWTIIGWFAALLIALLARR